MSIQLVQRDDKNMAVDVENPMNISDLMVRQSPSRSVRAQTQPLFPESGASKRVDAPRVNLDRRTSFPGGFSRSDRRPSSHVMEKRHSSRRGSRRRREDSGRRREDSGRRREDSGRRREDSGRRRSRDDVVVNRVNREDGDDVNVLPVELDLLANPKKKKKETNDSALRFQEDFSDNSVGGEERKDAFVRDNERFDFEKKVRGDSVRRGSRDSRRKDSRRKDSMRKDSRRRDPRRRDSRDRRDSRRRDSRDRRDSRSGYSRSGQGSVWGSSQKYMSYEEQQQRRQRVFERFDKLMRRNVQVNKRFLDPSIELSEQENEADRLEKHIEVEESIQFQRKALMAFSTGAEFLNNKYNPVGLYLTGWSESVMEDIETYDPVFEDLYEKYHTQVSMSPEFKLIFMLASSAFMYHLSNTLFKSQMPGMGGMGMGGNPDMRKNMRRSAMGAVNGMMGTRPPRSGMDNMGGLSGMRQPQQFQHPSAAQSAPPSSFRREMRGPNTNTNDLLNEFMDRNPNNINDTILHEIDDILDNPSDEDEPSVRNVNLGQGVTLDL